MAVFVLQLLWNMAGFAVVGSLHERSPSDPPPVSVSVFDAQANDGKGLADLAHGLLDELPDLPDSLLRWTAHRWGPAPTPPHTTRLSAGRPPPLPVALFRPPPRA